MAADTISNTSSVQRAQRAEKKVERLERELDALKARLKDKPATKEMDVSVKERAYFQLNEQVKDLKYQVATKTEEHIHLQETLTTRTGEYEAKLKKMREIFGQATKNIDKYRATITSHEQTIARVNDELAEMNLKASDLENTVATLKDELGLIQSELKDVKTTSQFKIDQLEARKRQLGNQLDQTKSDFEQYKKRAHQLLQQKSNKADDTRLSELQNQIRQLEGQKIDYEAERAEQERKIALMDLDIRQLLDRIRDLQAKQTTYQDTKDELNEKRERLIQLENQIKYDHETFEKELKAVKEENDRLSQQLVQFEQQESNKSSKATTMESTKTIDQQQEQEMAMETIMDYLNEDNTRLRRLLEEKEQICVELQQKILKQQQAQQGEGDDDISKTNQSLQENGTHVDVYESMMQLLSPLVPRQEPKDPMEIQMERMKDMLQEREDQIIALRKEEKILKDELMKLESMDKRQNMSAEYIKNVVLKFLTSENKEFLVPVIAKVLFLDPNETEQLRRAA